MGIYETVYIDFDNLNEHYLLRIIGGRQLWDYQYGRLYYNNGMCGIDDKFVPSVEKLLASYPLSLSGSIRLECWSTYTYEGMCRVYRPEVGKLINGAIYFPRGNGTYSRATDEIHISNVKLTIDELPPKKDLLAIKN